MANLKLHWLLLAVLWFVSPSLLWADVDVYITDARVLDPQTGLPTNQIVISQAQTLTLVYEVDVTTVVFAGEDSVIKKIELTKELPAQLAGAVIESDLGLGWGNVKKQDGTVVKAHDLDIIEGALPGLASSVGTPVAENEDCPDAPIDQANGVHPYTQKLVVGNTKMCKHFVGDGTVLELKAFGGEVREEGFVPPPTPRIYTIDYPCLWNEIKKQVNEPGSATETMEGTRFSVPDVTPGTYPIIVTVDIEVEDAVDIDPSNNVFSFSYDLVVTSSPIPTLTEWVLIVLALSVAGFFVWQLRRRRKAVISHQ